MLPFKGREEALTIRLFAGRKELLSGHRRRWKRSSINCGCVSPRFTSPSVCQQPSVPKHSHKPQTLTFRTENRDYKSLSSFTPEANVPYVVVFIDKLSSALYGTINTHYTFSFLLADPRIIPPATGHMTLTLACLCFLPTNLRNVYCALSK